MENSDAWLQNLKVGDFAIIRTRDYRIVGKVDRLTKTMIMVKYGEGCESRFQRGSGYSVGTSIWDSTSLDEATPELIAEVLDENRTKHLVNYLSRKLNWNNVKLEILEKVYTLVKETKQNG